MGIYATLRIVDCKPDKEHINGPHVEEPSETEREFDLDQSWKYLDSALIEFGEPVARAFQGDYASDMNGKDAYSFNSVSPELVKRIADALAKLPFQSVADSMRKEYNASNQEFTDDLKEYLEYHYANLSSAYALAAKLNARIDISKS